MTPQFGVMALVHLRLLMVRLLTSSLLKLVVLSSTIACVTGLVIKNILAEHGVPLEFIMERFINLHHPQSLRPVTVRKDR